MRHLAFATFYAVSIFAQSTDSSESSLEVTLSTTTTSTSLTPTITSTALWSTSSPTGSGYYPSSGGVVVPLDSFQNTDATYTVSVVATDQVSSTYVVNCAYGPSQICPDDDFTMTSAASSVHFTNYDTTTDGIPYTHTEVQTCTIYGTASTSCVLSQEGYSGTSTTTLYSASSSSGNDLPFEMYVIAADQGKLATASDVTRPVTNDAPPIISPTSTSTSTSTSRNSYSYGNAATRATILNSATRTGLLATIAVSVSAVFAFAILL